jgi:hypothetical protein
MASRPLPQRILRVTHVLLSVSVSLVSLAFCFIVAFLGAYSRSPVLTSMAIVFGAFGLYTLVVALSCLERKRNRVAGTDGPLPTGKAAVRVRIGLASTLVACVAAYAVIYHANLLLVPVVLVIGAVSLYVTVAGLRSWTGKRAAVVKIHRVGAIVTFAQILGLLAVRAYNHSTVGPQDLGFVLLAAVLLVGTSLSISKLDESAI